MKCAGAKRQPSKMFGAVCVRTGVRSTPSPSRRLRTEGITSKSWPFRFGVQAAQVVGPVWRRRSIELLQQAVYLVEKVRTIRKFKQFEITWSAASPEIGPSSFAATNNSRVTSPSATRASATRGAIRSLTAPAPSIAAPCTASPASIFRFKRQNLLLRWQRKFLHGVKTVSFQSGFFA